MQLTYNEFVVDIFDDITYNPESADNGIQYDRYYADENPEGYRLIQHGIRISNIYGEVVKQVCVAALGGKTGIHEHCCVLLNHSLTICCADSVFSLTLPELALKWQTKADQVTCFEIFTYQDDFIIHGELEISRLDREGKVIWQFSGNDIFTTPTGKDDFNLIGNTVYATNWDNVTYKLDAETGHLLDYDTTKAKYS